MPLLANRSYVIEGGEESKFPLEHESNPQRKLKGAKRITGSQAKCILFVHLNKDNWKSRDSDCNEQSQ